MATEPSGIIVPAYDHPGELSDWGPAFAAAPYLWPGRLIVVANPNNGPGDDSAPLEPYVAAIDAVTRRCGKVVGYVHDCYHDHHPASNCPRATPIEEDIARWFAAYPKVGGIFIDQVDVNDVERARELKNMVDTAWEKQWKNFPERRAITVLNPGVIPPMDTPVNFMTETDPAIVVIQEQSYNFFRTNWPPLGWVKDRDGGDQSIPARRLAIIAHTPQDAAADVAMLVEKARRYSIGSVYANDLAGPNYNKLSLQLVPLAKRICQLHSKFGFPCTLVTAPVCWGSQVLDRVWSGGKNAFARR